VVVREQRRGPGSIQDVLAERRVGMALVIEDLPVIGSFIYDG
jgi:hypothetical protein